MASLIQDEGILEVFELTDLGDLCVGETIDEDQLCVGEIIDEDNTCTGLGDSTQGYRADTTLITADNESLTADYAL